MKKVADLSELEYDFLQVAEAVLLNSEESPDSALEIFLMAAMEFASGEVGLSKEGFIALARKIATSGDYP